MSAWRENIERVREALPPEQAAAWNRPEVRAAYLALTALTAQMEAFERKLVKADGDGVRLLRERQAAERGREFFVTEGIRVLERAEAAERELVKADGNGVRVLREKQAAERERDEETRLHIEYAAEAAKQKNRADSAEQRVKELEAALRACVEVLPTVHPMDEDEPCHVYEIWQVGLAALAQSDPTEFRLTPGQRKTIDSE